MKSPLICSVATVANCRSKPGRQSAIECFSGFLLVLLFLADAHSKTVLVSAEGCRSKCSLSGAGWSVIISITKQPASPLELAGTDQFKHKTQRRPDGRITFHVLNFEG